ncbi:MAG: DUF1549 domain-containing protein [Pirellulaceae bacterium]
MPSTSWSSDFVDLPRYGERWAVPWLDLARYADSNGFRADQIRDNWAYRDWVIRAQTMACLTINLSSNAVGRSDLLPNATLDQRIATEFSSHDHLQRGSRRRSRSESNQPSCGSSEHDGCTVFLGTTLECAQCHDLKYDPFTQEDYYGLLTLFQ